MTKKKAILFIGLGDWNVSLIDISRKFGYTILATNKNPHSLSLKMADAGLVADGNDVVSILNFALEKNKLFDIRIVYSGSELFVAKEASCEALGLPYNSLSAAVACQNKELARDLLNAAHITIPKGESFGKLTEVKQLARKLGYPLIIKPTNRLGGEGVTVVSKSTQLEQAYDRAKEFSEKMIVEKFLEGTLHDVNGFFHNGKFYKCGISDKAASSLPYVYVDELSCPSILSRAQKKELYNLLYKSARAIGIEHGPVKADVILTNEGFVLMEIALRFHGPLGTVYCLPFGEGIEPFKYYLSVLAGKKYTFRKRSNYVYIKAINPGIGKISRFKSLNEAKKITGVLDVLLAKRIGDKLEKPKSNFDLCGYVVLIQKDKTRAMADYEKFISKFGVILN